MPFDPFRHHRRSIRLRGYDYSQAGAYFVTICTQGRRCLFGEVVDGEMVLNEAGWMVHEEWFKTAELRPYVRLDQFQVMPNHVHGIIWIVEDGDGGLDVGATRASPLQETNPPSGTAHASPLHETGPASPVGATAILRIVASPLHETNPPSGTTHASPLPETQQETVPPRGPQPGSLGAIVGAFKSAVTKHINRLRGTPGARLWQRNYHEHIIRSERELERLRAYIAANPARWPYDPEHPRRAVTTPADAYPWEESLCPHTT